MSEFRRYTGYGESRPPTWWEKERLTELRETGTEDVYMEPGSAPLEFWIAIIKGTYHFLAGQGSVAWVRWGDEITLNYGLVSQGGRSANYSSAFEQALLQHEWRGQGPISTGMVLTLIEQLADVAGDEDGAFRQFFNERARWFRVGLRLEDDNRFVATTSEALHVEIVQPALRLLADPRFEDVNDLYRKGFERASTGDHAGAITAATSAVETMLKIYLPEMGGQTLGPLAEKARAEGLITPALEEFIKKLYGLREESDAHQAGTDEFALALLALHLAGSLILYLGETTPPT